MTSSELAAVIISPFIKRDPALWFHILEAAFDLASPKPVKESKTKYNFVVAFEPTSHPECCIPKAAEILEPLEKFLEGLKNKKKYPHSNVYNSTKQLEWNDDANLSFKSSNDALANATLLRHPIPGAEHILEGWAFVIYTDRKPLTCAFHQKSDKCIPCQLRHLDIVSQFSTDIRYTKGCDNSVSDALSRIEMDANSPTVIE
ncbi:transposon Ty3-I Gag-Pol polyprotein [Nephila pilipes]|uniref:Transposon Ty3-I Gag-Pol polyprotein n=1 Tax=Nephila pilipes TaxID=299642 RepID=A0A8X6Q0S4_NEPPI|nr:transposon Ty3-I Gag-Pol polyprotein [Nephila pilipes]